MNEIQASDYLQRFTAFIRMAQSLKQQHLNLESSSRDWNLDFFPIPVFLEQTI